MHRDDRAGREAVEHEEEQQTPEGGSQPGAGGGDGPHHAAGDGHSGTTWVAFDRGGDGKGGQGDRQRLECHQGGELGLADPCPSSDLRSQYEHCERLGAVDNHEPAEREQRVPPGAAGTHG